MNPHDVPFNWQNLGMAVVTSIIAAVLAVVGSLYLARRREAAHKDERVRALELQIAVLSQQVSPLWTAAQAILVKQLTHYHTPELDALMLKIHPFTLTATEEARLYILLEARTRDVGSLIDSSERDAATMLPLVMARVRAEQHLLAQDAQIMMVAIPRTQAK